ncbi:hypothetical protein HGO26_05685 [Shewanella sp. S-1]|uniref:Tail fiber protein n=1 Tax=Shewanella oncorhynchi TaxID=2726434 RepID=A0ABX1KLH0_9GAMM|nr:hypothetical protein [Shewanella oncorhynchi]NLQ22369.1 hypothetical protein [Shewanella oncorhynchi]
MAFETISLGTQPAGTGGDTARTAFEKVNRNFIAADVLAAAMSQAQFEAIRAQNNEQFAASGFVHFGQQVIANAVNEGLTTSVTVPNNLWMGIHDAASGRGGKSKTKNPLLNFAGVTFYIDRLAQTYEYLNTIKFPQAPDGKTVYNKTTGVVTNYATAALAFAAAAADTVNLEVVTDRVDMWGFEAFLEEVNTTNPYVYPNGLIQSQATTMDGIATSASARPVTYYAVFDGDTGSKGKGLNYFVLSDANKKKVLSNSNNNLYYLDDGRLVQWRLRQRTFVGPLNGDWSYYDVSTTMGNPLGFSSTTAGVRPQGISNTKVDTVRNQYFSSVPTNAAVLRNDSLNLTGLYSVRNHSDANATNIEGKCYFLVCGTVNRLNQGAYHPSFNPSGTASWTSAQQPYWACTWDNKDTRTKLSGEPTNTAGCFTGALGTSNGGFGNIGTKSYDGYNHPDKRFYDAIYADGQGGVCRDMRYSANGVDLVDYAEADQRVKNGTCRGFENIGTIKAFVNNKLVKGPSSGTVFKIAKADITGDMSWVTSTSYNNLQPCNGALVVDGVSHIVESISNDIGNSWWWLYCRSNGVATTGMSVYGCIGPYITLSVGGSFLQTDVIGDPANILATPQLVNGWYGSWIPEIPDGIKDNFPLSRKYVGSGADILRTLTINNGVSFSSGLITLSSPALSQTQFDNMPANQITLYQYKAFAKQTENAANAVVYGGNLGVGQVFATSDSFLPAQNRGTLLKESLTGGTKGIGAAYTNGAVQVLSVKQLTMSSDKLLSGRAAYDVKHDEIVIDGNTTINGVKALSYNVNLNQQAFIQYAYTELKHNGTNWGDDGKVTIVDNQSTKTDLNGNTVLVGTAKLKEPIGWIKNKV